MIEIPRLPDPPEGQDFPPGEAMGWWWYFHPGWDGAPMLYFRTPTGEIGRMVRHEISAAGIVTPSILVAVGDREAWHVGPPSRLLGWGPEDGARYEVSRRALAP